MGSHDVEWTSGKVGEVSISSTGQNWNVWWPELQTPERRIYVPPHSKELALSIAGDLADLVAQRAGALAEAEDIMLRINSFIDERRMDMEHLKGNVCEKPLIGKPPHCGDRLCSKIHPA